MANPIYDVFLSHSHTDAVSVEKVAGRLVSQEAVLRPDDQIIKPFLDKWEIIPGSPWQNALGRGLTDTGCCAVFLGAEEMDGWFEKESQVALDRQANDSTFLVIPVLLPGADEKRVPVFLKPNDRIDFRINDPTGEMFYRLVCGIRRRAPGRFQPKASATTTPAASVSWLELHFIEIKRLEDLGLLPKREADKARRDALKADRNKRLDVR